MAYTSKLKTAVKIAAVIASTKSDRSKIDLAGVEAGAKMLVGLHACASELRAKARKMNDALETPLYCMVVHRPLLGKG